MLVRIAKGQERERRGAGKGGRERRQTGTWMQGEDCGFYPKLAHLSVRTYICGCVNVGVGMCLCAYVYVCMCVYMSVCSKFYCNKKEGKRKMQNAKCVLT